MKSLTISSPGATENDLLEYNAGGGPTTLDIEELTNTIPPHPLGVKPSGNSYTATSNDKDVIGSWRALPDEMIAIILEHLDSPALRNLGATCRFLFAFCRSEDLWKALFIEYVFYLCSSCIRFSRRVRLFT